MGRVGWGFMGGNRDRVQVVGRVGMSLWVGWVEKGA